jgi:hypothetical protein
VLEEAAQELAVVDADLEAAERQLLEDAVDDRGDLGVVGQRQVVLADDVDVALVETRGSGPSAPARRGRPAGSGSDGTGS